MVSCCLYIFGAFCKDKRIFNVWKNCGPTSLILDDKKHKGPLDQLAADCIVLRGILDYKVGVIGIDRCPIFV